MFKDKNLIKGLLKKKNIINSKWEEVQLEFKWNKLISSKNIINSIKKIILIKENIEDIKGLENFQNLTYLNLWDNEITNLEPLQNLTNLINLWLAENKITNIKILENLSNLKFIDLGYNQIEDISPLTKLNKLEELWLIQNKKLWKLAKNYCYFWKDNKKIDKNFEINFNWKFLKIKKNDIKWLERDFKNKK